MNSRFYQRIAVLYSKEWLRLKRNPAALMAVGLIILMAFLVSLENTASKIQKQKEQIPCAIIYSKDSALIDFLRQDKLAGKFSFVKVEANEIGSAAGSRSLRCVAEITEHSSTETNISITFKAVDIKSEQMSALSRWLLAAIAMHRHNIVLKQTLEPIKDKQPATTLGNIDLGSNQAKSMIGAMMIFSAQYFLCCALFISFTGHEKERGILQSIALTTTSPTEILISKYLFHTTLSIIASFIIATILAPKGIVWAFYDYLLLLFVFSSIGFISVATIITSFNRNQSTAGLVGFCYLMTMGVIFSLAKKFKMFALIKAWMFEGYAIDLFSFWLNPPLINGHFNRVHFFGMLVNYLSVMGISIVLLILSLWVFKRRGWRNI